MIRRVALLLMLALSGMDTQAQSQIIFPLEQFAYPVLPTPGVYYDPTQSGTGLTVDRLSINGQPYVFSTYYHYDAAGAPTWLNLAAYVTQTSMADYTSTGLAAEVRSEWLRTTGGQCFDCAFTAPVVSTPPYGPRALQVIGGRHLKMAASGNAADRNMRLAKALVPNKTPSQQLLEKGAVWALKWRCGKSQPGDGCENGGNGWVYFVKRPASEKLRFQSNVYGLQEPSFLRMTDRNTPEQYELRKALPSYSSLPTSALQNLYGSGSTIITDDPAIWDADRYSFVIDAASDRIRMLERCYPNNGAQTTACPTGIDRTRAIVTSVSDVIDAGPNEFGQERIVIRLWNMFKGDGTAFWEQEFELTRVPDAYARAIVPELPANIANGSSP